MTTAVGSLRGNYPRTLGLRPRPSGNPCYLGDSSAQQPLPGAAPHPTRVAVYNLQSPLFTLSLSDRVFEDHISHQIFYKFNRFASFYLYSRRMRR
jgi:hypothetical protein